MFNSLLGGRSMKNMAKISVLFVAVLLCAAPATASTILTLTGDVAHSTPDNYHPTMDALAGMTNHPFAYNPLSPTSPLPGQTYTGAQPVGFHGRDELDNTCVVAFTFGSIAGPSLFFDVYGRNELGGAEFRDNGLVIRLYQGDWVTPVFTSTPFDVLDGAPFHGRYTVPGAVWADRMTITGPDYMTILELRAVAPEPSVSLLGMVGGAVLLRRRSRARVNG
jgi:hypothetical protein